MRSLLAALLRLLGGPGASPPGTAGPLTRPASGPDGFRGTSRREGPPPTGAGGYPGDYRGVPEMVWAPRADADPDPGEVVWTWVPFEEDPSQGKDRPVLLIGRDGPWLLAVALTSKDHDRDAAQEAREGRLWVDIGSGDWDRQGRPSEVRVNRIVRVDRGRIRRDGGCVPRERFEIVARAVRECGGG